jgi:hypothetical protein
MWISGTLRASGEQRCRFHFDFSIFVTMDYRSKPERWRRPSMSEHGLHTSYANRRSAPLFADTLRNSAQRSWRTVEAAGRDANALIASADNEGFTHDAPGLDRDHRGEDAGKVRMQCTTGVRKVSAVVTVMMGLSGVP